MLERVLVRLRLALVPILFAGMMSGGVRAQSQNPTGGDYLAWPNETRGRYLLRIAGLAEPGADRGRHLVLAASIGTCITEALTVRKSGEAAAVAMLRQQPLSELAALCAVIEKNR